ncbi:PP2C family protein-serine/threonine phosphatase [Pleurocapsa sp. FMAR1]|uniref:PP2C family protein-serine/threonine phosphatase n=1 Tax=Pleurocapsa sp. FMAR1 TaxID=3040204 RepID=UPI0029C7D364|nr:protein phosphatase 2C domain-containing protein [Pleurocapsa sp. FMAR1]
MPHPEPKIQCSNPQCAASNQLEANCCHRCDTPLIRRYLWSNKAVSSEHKQALINGRYLALGTQIFLDTKPNKPPITPEEVPQEIVVYLQLFSCYPHVPQVYGLLDGTDVWLFDYGTVPSNATGKLDYPQQLIPKLDGLWIEANAFQQISWLWQIVKLWKPLLNKKVASTLLNSDQIRINGQIVQVIQLQQDNDLQPTLKDLGSLWTQWANNARPEIKEVLGQIASCLETGKIERVSQVLALLDKVADQCSKARKYSYRIYALSDSGPNRSNNEDAAYPIYHQPNEINGLESSLAIVCDGVGGHDGGEIASQATIKYLHDQISALKPNEQDHDPRKILKQLTKYINGSNDIISDRNDSEQRQERQRMGTTLVMTLAYAHEMYLAHVGDSRIYWITPNSCHQVTIDDDLASREVRLGYAVYRDSLQYPSAGALIQAIGMKDSATLHPNIQHYMIDGDCVFLLCTDGLSDFDRVEQQWRQKVLPVLEGTQNLTSAVHDLIDFANQVNGHDNVTVALVHCQVKDRDRDLSTTVSWSDIEYALKESKEWSGDNSTDSSAKEQSLVDNTSATASLPEQQIGKPTIGEPLAAKKQPKLLKPLIIALATATVIGLIAFIILQDRIDKPNNKPLPDSDSEIRQ